MVLTTADKMRRVVTWLNFQNENFNDKLDTIEKIEKCYDACIQHGIEFADNLDWEDHEDEEYQLACEVNNILGYEYYNIEL